MAANIELLDNQSGRDLIEVRAHSSAYICEHGGIFFTCDWIDTSELRQSLVEHNVAARGTQHHTSTMTGIQLPIIEAISACELDESTAHAIEIALKDGIFATSQNKAYHHRLSLNQVKFSFMTLHILAPQKPQKSTRKAAVKIS
ncbi:hypothetical protein B0H13DRAFT_2350999 [Mycena leptocephala]|nr:hypothetical protein B0H13DRAFT_2350999 [Mycena leptocephala]